MAPWGQIFTQEPPLRLSRIGLALLTLAVLRPATATLLGIVGGGGIGLYLYDSLRVSRYDQAAAFILLIIALVLVIEGVAVLIRRALK